MPTFLVKSPSGKEYRVNAPEGGTLEQAIEYAATVLEPQQAGFQKVDIRQDRLNPESQGFAMDALAGAGKAFTDLGLGARQLVGAADSAEAAEKRRLDDALMRTPGGTTGAIAGGIAATLPAMAVPGAASLTGAGVIGAGLGALQPAESGMERAMNVGLGAGLGYGGQKAGMALADKARQIGASRIVQAAADKRDAAPLDDLIKRARDAGYVIPPSTTNPSVANAAVESLAGKIHTAQAARIKNQRVTHRLVREAIGLPEGVPLTKETLKNLRSIEGKVYNRLSKTGRVATDGKFLDDLSVLSKDADTVAGSFGIDVGDAAAIKKLVDGVLVDKADASAFVALSRRLRESATGNFRSGKNELARAERQVANAVEDLLERHAGKSGNKGLVDSFRKARERIAKIHSVEGALNGKTVSAIKLARQLDKGKPLSGPLQLIAEMGQSFDDAVKITKGSPVRLTDAPATFIGGAGVATGNPLAAAALAFPAARAAARRLALSGPVQNNLLIPNRGPALAGPQAARLIGQYGPRGALPAGLVLGPEPKKK